MSTSEIVGTSRDAGRNVLHTVTVNGIQIGQRRSAHRYSYAFIRSIGSGDYVVTRWSRNPQTRSNETAVHIRHAAEWRTRTQRDSYVVTYADSTTKTVAVPLDYERRGILPAAREAYSDADFVSAKRIRA